MSMTPISNLETDLDLAAIDELRQILGPDVYDLCLDAAVKGQWATKQFARDSFALLRGIQGRPVEAFIRAFLPNIPEDHHEQFRRMSAGHDPQSGV